MGQPRQAVVAVRRARQRQHVRCALDVGRAQCVQRRVQAQVGRGVDHVRYPAGQVVIGIVIEAQARRSDVARQHLDAFPDGAGQFGPVPPGPRQPARRRGLILRPYQGN